MFSSLRDNFRKIPFKFRHWFSLIVFVVLLVVLSFLVWVFPTARFEIREKAVTSETSSKELRVLTIIFNPTLEVYGNQKLTNYMGWNDPDTLAKEHVDDFYNITNGRINFTIEKRIEVDGFPEKIDGYTYTDERYLDCWYNHSKCHSPDQSNYSKIFDNLDLCDLVNTKNITDVWIMGGPYFGFDEYVITGKMRRDFCDNNACLSTYGCFSCFNPPDCGKTVYIMGFNYERDTTLHHFGHRAEGALSEVIADGKWAQNELNEWNRFSLIGPPRTTYPYGHCGNIHYPPNGVKDYDYSNTNYVNSDCDDYYNYPNLQGNYKNISCNEWNCNEHDYMRWWFRHLPDNNGTTVDLKTGKTILNDWWRYVVDYDGTLAPQVATPTSIPTSSPTPTPRLTKIPTPTSVPTLQPEKAKFSIEGGRNKVIAGLGLILLVIALVILIRPRR